jgi:hypothetical protein
MHFGYFQTYTSRQHNAFQRQEFQANGLSHSATLSFHRQFANFGGIFYLLFRFRLRLFAIHMLDLLASLHRFLQQIARRKRDDWVIVIRHRQKRFRVSTHTPLMHFHIKGSKAPNDNTLSLDNGIRNDLKNIINDISALRFSIAKIIEFIYNINFLNFSSTFQFNLI